MGFYEKPLLPIGGGYNFRAGGGETGVEGLTRQAMMVMESGLAWDGGDRRSKTWCFSVMKYQCYGKAFVTSITKALSNFLRSSYVNSNGENNWTSPYIMCCAERSVSLLPKI